MDMRNVDKILDGKLEGRNKLEDLRTDWSIKVDLTEIDNSLEYSIVKVLYINNSVLTNKTYSGKTIYSDLGKELGCYLGSVV
jgi:hypothetical protein